ASSRTRRFTPDSDRIADIPGRQLSANLCIRIVSHSRWSFLVGRVIGSTTEEGKERVKFNTDTRGISPPDLASAGILIPNQVECVRNTRICDFQTCAAIGDVAYSACAHMPIIEYYPCGLARRPACTSSAVHLGELPSWLRISLI